MRLVQVLLVAALLLTQAGTEAKKGRKGATKAGREVPATRQNLGKPKVAARGGAPQVSLDVVLPKVLELLAIELPTNGVSIPAVTRALEQVETSPPAEGVPTIAIMYRHTVAMSSMHHEGRHPYHHGNHRPSSRTWYLRGTLSWLLYNLYNCLCPGTAALAITADSAALVKLRCWSAMFLRFDQTFVEALAFSPSNDY